MSKELDKLIANAEELNKNFALIMNDAEVTSTQLDSIILAYVFIAFEHQRSIVSLIKLKNRVSAAALVRSVYDAFLRATWLSLKGDGVIATKISSDSFRFKSYEKMCKQIDNIIDNGISSDSQHFSNINERNINALHSYTHGGLHLLNRCMSDKHIQDNFTDEEMLEVVKSTSMNMLMAGYAFAGKVKNEKLIEKIRYEILNF